MNKINELACVAAESKPDIILVTESWCHPGIADSYLSINGYQLQPELRVDRSDTANGIGGGLLVYSRDGLDILPCDKVLKFDQYAKFTVNNCGITNTIFLIYRSPSSTDIEGLAGIIKSAPNNTLFVGDFNLPGINWENWTGSGRVGDFLDAAGENFFEQLVTFPTHLKGNILDLVLSNSTGDVHSVTAEGRLGKSDHTMIRIQLQGQPAKVPVSCGPNWAKADWDGMRGDLADTDWYSLLREQNTEEAWESIKGRLTSLTAKFVPLQRRRPPDRPIWMNKEILRAMSRKKRLWRKLRRGDNSTEYNEAEKKLRNLIRNAKRNLEKKLAKDKGNSRPFYAYLKQKTTTRAAVGPLRDQDNSVVTDSMGMAKILNQFFSSVFTEEGTDPVPEVSGNYQFSESLRNVNFRVRDTRELIKKLKTRGAPGPDGITARLLQELAWEISPALTILFRKSMAEGSVPADWRRANVTPIFKKGSKSDPGNYRPVSLTSICGKLMEGHIKREITRHLTDNNLLLSTQHGFMSGKSCTTNLLEFMEMATKAADEGLSLDVVYLDFAKAFDKVPKKRLLKKLQSHGIQGPLLAWVEAWLTGREQRVVLNGECSEWADVLSGVPQGSLLGPPLFSVYINDIDYEVRLLITLLLKFADDTKLGQLIRNQQDSIRLQECLDKLMEWAARWGMAFNTKKCKVMHIGKHNPRHQYTMGGHVLDTTEEERDIGVQMSSNLKPGGQCGKAAMTANRVLGQVSRAFHYRDKETFVKVYKLYILPHLEFAVPAWCPWTKTDADALEKVQRRAVNMVSGLKSRDYSDRLKELGMPTLTQRREELDMTEMFKIMTKKSAVDPNIWFESASRDGVMTRQAADPLNVMIPAARLDIRKNFFSVRVCDKWNSLPSEIKNSANVKIFKNSYRRYMSTCPPQATD